MSPFRAHCFAVLFVIPAWVASAAAYCPAAETEAPAGANEGAGLPVASAQIAKPEDPSSSRTLSNNIITNSTGMRLRLVPAGRFLMGSPAGEKGRDSDEVAHEVILSRPFYVGVTEVTQPQYQAVMGGNPSSWGGDDMPVQGVNWFSAVEFCRRLSEKDSELDYRLPTEAEWEYACRAGSADRFPWGDDPECLDIEAFAWHEGNSGQRAHEVGRKKPNPWGLYDMTGNVWEWCSDSFGKYPPTSRTDPFGPDAGDTRVRRGGSWYVAPRYLRSANRNCVPPSYGLNDMGFRVVATPAENR